LHAKDDYKRCICDTWGNGKEDCPQATKDDDDDKTLIILEDLIAALQEVHNKPHYSEDLKSRTTYQVDKSLDYIELKLREFYKVMIESDLIK